MKIIFLTGGAREQALEYLLKMGENVVAVITPYVSKSNSRFENAIKVAIDYGVTVIQVSKEDITEKLKGIEFDLAISCGFSYIIDSKLFENKKAINVHPTLLPQYRGFRSGPFQIINGEKESGVTIHQLVDEMDKGDIILQEKFVITDFDTTKSVFRKARELEPRILYEAVKLIKSGQETYTKQDESLASEYNYIRTPKDSEVDWNKSLKQLYNEIRACDPVDYPAFFWVNGEKVFIKLWRKDKLENEGDLI